MGSIQLPNNYLCLLGNIYFVQYIHFLRVNLPKLTERKLMQITNKSPWI